MAVKLSMGKTLDLNFTLNGGAVDSGLFYSISPGSNAFISINAAGVITPIALGVAVVYVKDASGNLLYEETVEVISSVQDAANTSNTVKDYLETVVAAFANNLSGATASQVAATVHVAWTSTYAGSTTYRIQLLDIYGSPVTLINGLDHVDIAGTGTSHQADLTLQDAILEYSGTHSVVITDINATSGTTSQTPTLNYTATLAPSSASGTAGHISAAVSGSDVVITYTNVPAGNANTPDSVIIQELQYGITVIIPAASFPASGTYTIHNLAAENYDFAIGAWNNTPPYSGSSVGRDNVIVGVSTSTYVDNLLTITSVVTNVAGQITIAWDSTLTGSRPYKLSLLTAPGNVETVLTASTSYSGLHHTATFSLPAGGTWNVVKVQDISANASAASVEAPLTQAWGTTFTIAPVAVITDNLSAITGTQNSASVDVAWTSSNAASTTYRLALLDASSNPILLSNGLLYEDVTQSGTSHTANLVPMDPFFAASGTYHVSVTDTLATSGTTTGSNTFAFTTPAAPATATGAASVASATVNTGTGAVNVTLTGVTNGGLAGANGVLVTNVTTGQTQLIATGSFPFSGSTSFAGLAAGNYKFTVAPYNSTAHTTGAVQDTVTVGLSSSPKVLNTITNTVLTAPAGGNQLTVAFTSSLSSSRTYRVSLYQNGAFVSYLDTASGEILSGTSHSVAFTGVAANSGYSVSVADISSDASSNSTSVATGNVTVVADSTGPTLAAPTLYRSGVNFADFTVSYQAASDLESGIPGNLQIGLFLNGALSSGFFSIPNVTGTYVFSGQANTQNTYSAHIIATNGVGLTTTAVSNNNTPDLTGPVIASPVVITSGLVGGGPGHGIFATWGALSDNGGAGMGNVGVTLFDANTNTPYTGSGGFGGGELQEGGGLSQNWIPVSGSYYVKLRAFDGWGNLSTFQSNTLSFTA
jgi:hypothetical protein